MDAEPNLDDLPEPTEFEFGDLFERAIDEDGVLGDVLIEADESEAPHKKVYTRLRFKSRDAAGHEHDPRDGRFTSGHGGTPQRPTLTPSPFASLEAGELTVPPSPTFSESPFTRLRRREGPPSTLLPVQREAPKDFHDAPAKEPAMPSEMAVVRREPSLLTPEPAKPTSSDKPSLPTDARTLKDLAGVVAHTDLAPEDVWARAVTLADRDRDSVRHEHLSRAAAQLRSSKSLSNGSGRFHWRTKSGAVQTKAATGDDTTGDDPDELADLIADILGGIYGEQALDLIEHLEDEPTEEEMEAAKTYTGMFKSWAEVDHPRGKGGKFIPKHSAEARSAAHVEVGKALKAPASPEGLKALVEHLSILTVKQLQALKKEHGLSASGKLKADLVVKLADRLHRGRSEPEEPAPQAQVEEEAPPVAVKAKPKRKANLYGDKLPVLPVGKPLLRVLQYGDAYTQVRLGSLLDPDLRKLWEENGAEGVGRMGFDADKIGDMFSRQEIEALVQRGWLSRSTVHGGGKVREQYTITRLAKAMQAARLIGLETVSVPTTKSEAHVLANQLKYGPELVARQVLDYLGLDEKQLSVADLDDKLPGILDEMLYRHYNPVPIAKRIAKDKALQAKVKTLATVHDDLLNDSPELAPFTEKIKVLDAQSEELWEETSAISDRMWGSELETMTPEVRASLQERLDEIGRIINDDLGVQQAELYNLRANKRHEVRDRVIGDALRVPKPSRIAIADDGFDPAHTEEEKKAVGHAAAWLTGKVQVGSGAVENVPEYRVSHDDSDISGRGGPNAYYRVATHEINVHTGMLSVATNVHEMGHGIEYKLQGVQSAAQRFLNHRVGKEPLRKLKEVLPTHGYGDWEYGRKDDFDKALGESHAWYAGKALNGEGTEIVSMGVEELYRNPSSFAEKDPEYCAFILGVLNGRLRDNPVP